ncbi:STY4851/ECs_5259 family protein [Vreelandella salicampi]|uniref:Uncharacterized protein n=1 Tax=Vreelandella salicampi TaxID=1449798 RepID=A0A7Z0LKM0_9GAMM|nr:STY4851/ECs_5259 family protein [Halomonas salicampi]NYS60705.1 hypothetical protein [Halomonas salicampi]
MANVDSRSNEVFQTSLRHWVYGYLSRRGLTTPSGWPLYSYATKQSELNFLAALLPTNAKERHNPVYKIYWAAGYCLFIADKYRRDYQASWSWQAFDNELGVHLQPNEHIELVKLGLGYWNRPIRYRTYSADYLGSLFAEGGLPWRLLQNEQHGFGRAIKAGLHRYHEYKRDDRDLVPVIREYSQYFPQSFQNDEKYQLLASIAETLMRLAEQHGLDQQDDPAAFLNRHAPQWRKEFPLPLEEENGVALVNEWLVDAGTRIEERKRAREMARAFTCEHKLDGAMVSACLEAKVWLSPSWQINLEGRHISNSRVELALYEGERLALKLGVAYGRLEADRLMIKMPAEVATLRRQSPEKPLFLVASSAGERLNTQTIQSSEVDWQQLPTVFVEEEEGTRLAGIASVQCKAPEVLLRVPETVQVPYAEWLLTDAKGGHWYRIGERCVVTDADARYVIEPGKVPDIERVEWQGAMSSYSTLPLATWRGWPRCLLIDAQDSGHQPKAFKVNGELVNGLESLSSVGSFKVDILGKDHCVVARRKLGVLPRDFSLAAMPASSRVPARIVIRSVKTLNVCVRNSGLRAEVRRDGVEITVQLLPGRQTPERVELEIKDTGTSAEGVVLRVPYPEEGAQLVAADGRAFEGVGLKLECTLGMTLILTPPPEVARTFFVSLELMEQATPLVKQYRYRAQNNTVQVSLYSLYDDILSLLSCCAEQDATVRCRVETAQLHKQFYIYRYEASIRFTNEYCEFFELVDHGAKPLMHQSEGTTVMAMQLTSPESEAVVIVPSAPNGVVTGFYEVPKALHKDGPWLLYPEEGAPIAFRPAIHVSDKSVSHVDENTPINTLNAAARYYHPEHCPNAFDAAFDEMAGHFSHTSWQYLVELKQKYQHIPLSALEGWKHLARHPQAMALAVFRLEMPPAFAERLTHELAVIWEVITVSQWQAAVQEYVEAMSQQFGLPEQMMREKARERMALLSMQVPAFKDFSEILCDGDRALPGAPPLQAILPHWLNDLRAHNEDATWPTNLSGPLTRWVQDREAYAWLTELTMPEHMNAVCFMPIFAACLTAGVAHLEELSVGEAALRFGFRVLSDFDRNGWYEPVYSASLSSLLNAKGNYS